MASDWLEVVLPANQDPCKEILVKLGYFPVI